MFLTIFFSISSTSKNWWTDSNTCLNSRSCSVSLQRGPLTPKPSNKGKMTTFKFFQEWFGREWGNSYHGSSELIWHDDKCWGGALGGGGGLSVDGSHMRGHQTAWNCLYHDQPRRKGKKRTKSDWLFPRAVNSTKVYANICFLRDWTICRQKGLKGCPLGVTKWHKIMKMAFCLKTGF